MPIKEIFRDKTIKAKQATELLCGLLENKALSSSEIIKYASEAGDVHKASCIESIEFFTRLHPESLDAESFLFISDCLASKSPRVKMEAGRVISNTAQMQGEIPEKTITQLLENAEHSGTVVRWSAATALNRIVCMRLPVNEFLIPAITALIEKEEKNSIRKIYQEALRKVSKPETKKAKKA